MSQYYPQQIQFNNVCFGFGFILAGDFTESGNYRKRKVSYTSESVESSQLLGNLPPDTDTQVVTPPKSPGRRKSYPPGFVHIRTGIAANLRSNKNARVVAGLPYYTSIRKSPLKTRDQNIRTTQSAPSTPSNFNNNNTIPSGASGNQKPTRNKLNKLKPKAAAAATSSKSDTHFDYSASATSTQKADSTSSAPPIKRQKKSASLHKNLGKTKGQQKHQQSSPTLNGKKGKSNKPLAGLKSRTHSKTTGSCASTR